MKTNEFQFRLDDQKVDLTGDVIAEVQEERTKILEFYLHVKGDY